MFNWSAKQARQSRKVTTALIEAAGISDDEAEEEDND